MKLVSVVFCIIFAVSFGDHAPEKWDGFDYDYAGVNENDSNEIALNFDSSDIDKLLFENDEKESILECVDGLGDCQIEDNRSDSDEKHANDDAPSANDEEPIPDDGDAVEAVKSEEEKDDTNEGIGEVPVEAEEPQEENEYEEDMDDDDVAADDDSWSDSVKHEVEPLPLLEKDDLNKIFEETRDILQDDTENTFDDQPAEEIKNEESTESKAEIQGMIDKINKILDDANNGYDEQDEKSDEDIFSENKDDTIAKMDTEVKGYADLNADLNKLFEAYDKLKDGEPEEKESDEVPVDNVKDYEEKYGWPYKEASVLGERDYEYENIDDSNLSDIFKEIADDTAAEDTGSNEDDENKNTNEEVDSLAINDDNDSDLVDSIDESVDAAEKGPEKTTIELIVEPVKSETVSEENNNSEEDNEFDDTYDIPAQEEQEDNNQTVPVKQSYGEDGLVDDAMPKEADAEEMEPIGDENGDDAVDDIERFYDIAKTETTQKAISVDELNSAQFKDLMAQFAIAHQEDLDIHSEDFDKHIAPVHITLSDESVVISSPNYPSPYPTNNIIDWIFEVDGSGIELNITDLAVNGAFGDYLLIKPGGLDESGQDGLVFSYRLNAERRYRFFDVNRMFVRFEAKLGMSMLSSRGFQLSAKRIFAPESEPEVIPDPEPVVEPPRHTLTLHLAGLPLEDFRTIQDDFVTLIADMAAKYISNNDIYYGYNSTLEVTQITRTAVCNIHWPNHETCVEVIFGVPLNYGDEDLEPRLNAEDLQDMWKVMIGGDSFAARLSALGLQEYEIPNNRAVLTVWLVIAAGVIISMAMLAFALWRFSCFEDYTRMRSFSDTDSIRNEKRNLDLYPTPHQTLPPLYAESEYKWTDEKYDDSTRVDMGGFANKSYAREELYNFDSDEDVIAPRDRKGAISPKDTYAV